VEANESHEKAKKIALDCDNEILVFEKASAQKKAAETSMEIPLKVIILHI